MSYFVNEETHAGVAENGVSGIVVVVTGLVHEDRVVDHNPRCVRCEPKKETSLDDSNLPVIDFGTEYSPEKLGFAVSERSTATECGYRLLRAGFNLGDELWGIGNLESPFRWRGWDAAPWLDA